MDKTKLIPVIFLILVLLLGGAAIMLYTEKGKLTEDNKRLAKDKGDLTAERDSLRDTNNKLEREKQSYEERIQSISSQLSSIEKERDEWKKKFEDTSSERDALVEKLKEKPKVEVAQPMVGSTSSAQAPISEEYWADFVKVKAALEVKVEDLTKQLNEAKLKLSDLDKNNKELSMKLDELTKEKERVENEMEIKERTMRIVSRDLVSEREARKIAMEELNKLRGENNDLRRELVILNKEKVQLQTNIMDVAEKKGVLEQKISGVENVMKEKSLELEELQKELTSTIKGDSRVISRETASVELPPIVVKSNTGPRGLKGEVLAVNPEERFVVVNLGETSGIGPGNELKVLRKNKEIGRIQIIETRKDISAADIKDIKPGVSIQEGDTVISR
jgi:chromosome segregation ATPase